MENLELGPAIRLLREKRGYSARSLSTLVGYSPSYIGKIENGEIDPSLHAFALIARALSMTQMEITYLLNKAADT